MDIRAAEYERNCPLVLAGRAKEPILKHKYDTGYISKELLSNFIHCGIRTGNWVYVVTFEIIVSNFLCKHNRTLGFITLQNSHKNSNKSHINTPCVPIIPFTPVSCEVCTEYIVIEYPIELHSHLIRQPQWLFWRGTSRLVQFIQTNSTMTEMIQQYSEYLACFLCISF